MKYPNLYSQEKGYGSAAIFNETGLNGSDGKKDGVIDENGVTTYSVVTGYTDGYTARTDPYVTRTYYSYLVNDCLNTNLGVNTAPEGLIKNGLRFWLASRSVDVDGNYAYFGVRAMNPEGRILSSTVFESDGNARILNRPVFPVVSLGTNVTLTKDAINSTEETTYWNIEY